jgi:hypothetical protein
MADSNVSKRRSEAAKKSWTPERRAAYSEKMKGPGNPFWKGGKSVASNGYVLVKVWTEHHLADVRGYAYEHRLVAEQKLGRALAPGEIAHHDDEDKLNNLPSNIKTVGSRADHALLHRRVRQDLRLPGEANPTITCACGCGAELLKFDSEGRPRSHVSGHNLKHQVTTSKGSRHG